jgi:hypothetical protein
MYASTIAHKSQLEAEGVFFRQPSGSTAKEGDDSTGTI